MAKKEPDFKETLSFQQYRGFVEFLELHIQLIDASLTDTENRLKLRQNKNEPINVALGVDPTVYDKLNHPIKQATVFKHSQRKSIEYSLIQVYNVFTIYLRSVLEEMYKHNPIHVVSKAVVTKNGDSKDNLSMSFADIVKFGNYDVISHQMVSRIFRGFEELRSTSKLISKILDNTKIIIDQSTVDNALKYLEMRHLFIHNQGKVDDKFERTYGDKFSPNLKANDKLPTDYTILKEAISAITCLCNKIDSELISKNFVEVRKFKC